MGRATPPAGAILGLFSSSLVPIQTSPPTPPEGQDVERYFGPEDIEADRGPDGQAWALRAARAEEVSFRHSGWAGQRARVLDALRAAGVRPGRIERFEQCGSFAMVQFNPDERRHRIKASYCGDRFCLPCANARARRVSEHFEKLAEGGSVLKIELTLRHEGGSLLDALRRLYAGFEKLRKSDGWKRAIRGGVAFVEIKRGANSGEWHPHLHVVCVGSYFEQKALSAAWQKATGASYVVWIRRAEQESGAVRYACKYAGKGWDHGCSKDHGSLVECIVALRGRRLFLTFGTWYGISVQRPSGGDPTAWRNVCRLSRLCRATARGESWALRIMSELGHAAEEAAMRVLERAEERSQARRWELPSREHGATP